MSERANELARRLDEANAELARAIEACSDATWKSPCPEEGWPIGVTAHHVAATIPEVMDFVQLIAAGQPLPPMTRDIIDQGNAEHARAAAGCTKADALQLLRENGAMASRELRGFGDEQLDRKGQLFVGEMSAQAVIEAALIGHVAGHLQSIRSAAPA